MENTVTTSKTNVPKNHVLVFDIDSQGVVMQQLTENPTEVTLENTLFQRLYPDAKCAVANVPMGFLDGFEESKVANAITRIECKGVVYRPVGSSSSAAKDGQFWLVDSSH